MSRSRFTPQTIRAFVPRLERPYESNLVFPGVFTAAQCQRIVETGLALEPRAGLVGTLPDEYGADGETRRARIAWIPSSDEHLWIFDKLARVAERANRMYEFDLLGFTEDLQFTCYDRAGSFYGWHQDGLEGELAGRKLSMVLQLSDPASYEGSDLEMFQIEQDYPDDLRAEWGRSVRGQGAVIAFPSYEFHRVTPLTAGRRHSLVSWIGGPPFR